MNQPNTACGTFSFGNIIVDVNAHTLLRDNLPQVLEPKAFRVLLYVLSRPGEVLTKNELLDAVWGHRCVTPNVLSQSITQIRHALGDAAHQSRYIETVPTLGYRFIATLMHMPYQQHEREFISQQMKPDTESNAALFSEMQSLLANLNGQHDKYPALTRHLAFMVSLFGDKPSGVMLYELALEYGLEKMISLEMDLPWRDKKDRQQMDGSADYVRNGKPSS
jgi:DNA-binding winged helix-turn-helix (wHTH) protein